MTVREFSQWLNEEMQSRSLNQSELSRRAGIAQSTVSFVLSGDRQPGTDFCTGVAHALGMPPERVFRKAGLLPPRIIGGEHEEQKAELLDYYEALGERDRDTALAVIRTLYERQGPYVAELRPDKEE